MNLKDRCNLFTRTVLKRIHKISRSTQGPFERTHKTSLQGPFKELPIFLQDLLAATLRKNSHRSHHNDPSQLVFWIKPKRKFHVPFRSPPRPAPSSLVGSLRRSKRSGALKWAIPKSTLHHHFLIGMANCGVNGKPHFWTNPMDFSNNSRCFALQLSSWYPAVAACDLRCPSAWLTLWIGSIFTKEMALGQNQRLAGPQLGVPNFWPIPLWLRGFCGVRVCVRVCFCLCLCLCVRVSVCQSVRICVCAPVRMSICL